MPSTNESARGLARRLIELEESRPRSHSTPEAAPLEACYRLHVILCNWVGGIGCDALTTRALRMTESTHPALEELTIGINGRPYFDRVNEAIEAYDEETVAAAMEAFIANVLGLLSRLVGEDLVASLAEQATDPAPDEPDIEKETA